MIHNGILFLEKRLFENIPPEWLRTHVITLLKGSGVRYLDLPYEGRLVYYATYLNFRGRKCKNALFS